ncbi:isoamylase early set domain-containing protein [bacterium]|nr:isoamylase early set domain-containing protein [bacterium]
MEKIGLFLKKTKIIIPDDFTDKVLNKLPEDSSILQSQKKSFIFTLQWKWASAVAVIAFLLINYMVFISRGTLENNINFTLKMPEAQTVYLVGDFNDWDINAYKLVRQNGSWKIKLNLPQGRYQYVFVIDGNKWIPDPEAKEYIDNGYGGKNSILDITRL